MELTNSFSPREFCLDFPEQGKWRGEVGSGQYPMGAQLCPSAEEGVRGSALAGPSGSTALAGRLSPMAGARRRTVGSPRLSWARTETSTSFHTPGVSLGQLRPAAAGSFQPPFTSCRMRDPLKLSCTNCSLYRGGNGAQRWGEAFPRSPSRIWDSQAS